MVHETDAAKLTSHHERIQDEGEELQLALPSPKIIEFSSSGRTQMGYQLSYFRHRTERSDYFEVRARKAYERFADGSVFTAEGRESQEFINTIRFSVSYDYSLDPFSKAKAKSVRLGPYGRVSMSPEGIGLGSVLLSEAIVWLQSLDEFIDLPVERVMLAAVDEEDPENKVRRNALYENAGLQIYFEDDEPGRYAAARVGDLNTRNDYTLHASPQFTVQLWHDDNARLNRELEVERRKLQQYRAKAFYCGIGCAFVLAVLFIMGA